jgi:hypothetical protein
MADVATEILTKDRERFEARAKAMEELAGVVV